MKTTRDFRFDLIKAMAIGMVIVGHVLGCQEIARRDVLVDSFIIGVNMPLFFIVCGYFSVSAVENVIEAGRRCFGYLRSMFAYGCLLSLTLGLVGVYGSVGEVVKRCVTIPLFGMWFMWALMYSLVALALIRWMIVKLQWHRIWVRVLCCAVVYVGLLALPDCLFQVKDFKYAFPFVALGYGFRRMGLLSSARTLAGGLIWLFGVAVFACYLLFVDGRLLAFYWSSFDLLRIAGSMDQVARFTGRIVVGVSGVIAIAWPVLLAQTPNRIFLALSDLGKTTMGVYFLQWTVLTVLFVPAFRGCSLSFGAALGVSLVIWMICHALVCLFRKYDFCRKIGLS